MDLPDLDVHLLRCLDVLVAERHVTRAAERMNMTQPGMSAVLSRLRKVFNDPLLVRTPQGMELSENALEIAASVRRAMAEIQVAVCRRGSFDPARSAAHFTLMASDYVGLMIVPALMRRLRLAAPGVSISIAWPEPRRLREALSSGDVDLAVGFFFDMSDGLYTTTVAYESLVCLAARTHPLLDGSVTLAQYAQCEHIYFGRPPALISPIESILAKVLSLQGLERRIGLYVPSLGVMPRVVAESDLLATVPLQLAQAYLPNLPLQQYRLPFDTPTMPINAVWHERMHDNAAHRWLRSEVKAAAGTLNLTNQPPSTAA